jgi:autotransporter translocation and assembly factor TamB
MSEKNNHTEKKKRRKWPWIIPLCIIIVLGLLRLALMTGFVHRFVKNKIIEAANKSLNPQLTIGTLSGNLYHKVTLTNVALKQQDSIVASIDTLFLEYNPLSYFSHAFKIDEIKVVHPVLKLRQRKDGTWNAQHWVKTSSDTTSSTAAYVIHNVKIKRGRMDIFDPQLQQDSSFTIDGLNLAASQIHYSPDHYKADVDTLYFKAKHTLFNAPVALAASANVDDSSFALHKFSVITGHSRLAASGKLNLVDTTGHFSASARPLGWQDVAAVDKNSSFHKNINMSLGFNADKKQGDVSFSAKAAGIKNFMAKVIFHREPALVLTSAKMSASRLNLETLLGDTTAQSLQDLMVQAHGRVPIENYQKGQLKGTLSAKNIREGAYQLDALQGRLSLNKSSAKLWLEPVKKKQRIIAEANVEHMWDENPLVSVTVKGSDINPAVWMQDTTYAGNLNFSGRISGKGWIPEKQLWSYKLTLNKSKLMGQSLNKANFSGRFDQQKFTNQSDIYIAKSAIHLKASAHNLQTVPIFSYTLNVRHLNLAGIKGYEQYPSNINGIIQGRGRGNSLQNIRLKTSALIDSSTLKKEPLQKLQLRAQVDDSVIIIRNAVLKSGMADGTLSGRVHLGDLYDSDNRLNLHAKIKDISPFASMAGVDVLRANGTIDGQIKPVNQDSLAFEGQLNLKNIDYANKFTAQKINGQARVDLQQNPRYSVHINIMQPAVSSVKLQKVALKTSGQMAGKVTSGSFGVELSGPEKTRITQRGTYRLNGDTTAATITGFTLSGADHTYSLAKSFHVRFANDVLQTDTLRINSDDKAAFVELAVPYADSLRQKGFVRIQKLQIAPLQKTLLNEATIKGTVFGRIHFARSDTAMKASGDIMLSNLSYEGAKLDTLQLKAQLQHKQLQAGLLIRKNGKNIAEGAANIPFNLQSSGEKNLSGRPIKGHLRVQPIALSEFSGLLKQMGISGAKGIVQFKGMLGGDIDHPKFKADFNLRNAKLSGIVIDSLTAFAHYQPEKSRLDLNAAVTSLQQKALALNAQIPLKLDFNPFNVALPGSGEKISLDMQANHFNLASLNDFMDHKMARNLKGFINGNVHISGPRENLESSGTLTLKNGAVRLVNEGIRLDHIQSTLQFQPDKIMLANLQMKSGKGSLHGQGNIELKKMAPKRLDLSIKAKNFKVANTDDYQAVINADMNIDGGLDSPKISGKLAIMNGFVKLNNFGQKSVENVQLDTTQAAPATQTSLYDSLSLNLNLSIQRRFYVLNERYLKMQIGLGGSLNIRKQPGKDLQVFGTLKTTGGYAEPLGKHFDLQKGELAFSGPPADPELNIRTLYEPPQTHQKVKIWYIIKGTVEDPQFEYKSDPPMDLSSILSYTLFGQPIYALNPAAQSATNAIGSKLATNFALKFLANRIESIATTKLGIDVFRIESTRVGGKAGTAITTGWYINPRVFFAIQNVITGSTPSPGFYLEYYLKNNLKLILSQGTEGQGGIGADLQWKLDY